MKEKGVNVCYQKHKEVLKRIPGRKEATNMNILRAKDSNVDNSF